MVQALGETFPLLSQLVPQASGQVQATLNASSINESLTAHDIEVSRLSWKCWFRIMVWAWGKTRKWTPEEEQAVRHSLPRVDKLLILCHSTVSFSLSLLLLSPRSIYYGDTGLVYFKRRGRCPLRLQFSASNLSPSKRRHSESLLDACSNIQSLALSNSLTAMP